MAKLCVRIICKGGKSTKEKMNCLDPGDQKIIYKNIKSQSIEKLEIFSYYT